MMTSPRLGACLTVCCLLLQSRLKAVEDLDEARGSISYVRGDEFKPGRAARERFILHADSGHSIPLHLSADQLRALGGARGLRKIRVRARRLRAAGPSFTATGALAAQQWDVQPDGGTSASAMEPRTMKWASLLLRFADSADFSPHPPEFYSGAMGMAYPGQGEYWSEVSYQNLDLSGSQAFGWYILPYPRDHYTVGGDVQLDLLKQDAIAAADREVDFTGFDGINLMFNADFGCCSWGGTSYVTADGSSRVLPMTWLPPWGVDNAGVLSHEMGHGIGMDHSSGPYSETYDSNWDPMSNGFYRSPPVHVNAFHKLDQGWIPASLVYEAAAGSDQVITLERLAQPALAAGNYLMARVPLEGGRYYAAEARIRAGYDSQAMGDAVLIWKVDPAYSDRKSRLVDASSNGDSNDEGGMWLPGETFQDTAANISIEVLSQDAGGFSLRVSNNAVIPSPPTPTPTFSPVPALGNGACASYFPIQSPSSPPCGGRVEPVIDFNFGYGGPAGTACGELRDRFSAAFSAELQAPYSGTYTLYVTADDGVRLWVGRPGAQAGILLVDRWVDQGATEYAAVLPFSLEAGQKAPLRLEYYENGGGAVLRLAWAGPQTPKQVVPQGRLYSGACIQPSPTVTRTPSPTSAATPSPTATPTPTFAPPPPASGRGLCASFHSNQSLSGTACSSLIAPQVAFEWGSSAPSAPGCPAGMLDHYSVRFSGEVQAVHTGSYTFFTRSDDGARLWITNPDTGQELLLIDKWRDQGATEWSGAPPFPLSYGRRYPIRMETYENGGQALAQLRWQGPGLAKQLIPQERLYPSAQCPSTDASASAGLAPRDEAGPKQATPGILMHGRRLLAGLDASGRRLGTAFHLGQEGAVRLLLLDLSGGLVSRLDLGHLGLGKHRADMSTLGLAPGLYFLLLQVDTGSGWRNLETFKLAKKPA